MTDNLIEAFGQHGDQAQRRLIREGLGSRSFNHACVSIIAGDHPVSVKRWAFEAVAAMPGARNGRLARQGLRAEAMTVRLHTLIGIASGRIPSRVDWLFDLLDDESGGIRLNALEVLIRLRPRRIQRELPRLCRDPKPYLRKAAAEAMRVDGSKRSRP